MPYTNDADNLKKSVADPDNDNKYVPEEHVHTEFAGVAASATVTVSDEAANARTASIQLKDNAGVNLAVQSSIFAFLSDDANGNTGLIAAVPDGGVVAGTNGAIIPVVTGKAFQLISEADGTADITITHAGGLKPMSLILVLPNGSLVKTSVSFAA